MFCSETYSNVRTYIDDVALSLFEGCFCLKIAVQLQNKVTVTHFASYTLLEEVVKPSANVQQKKTTCQFKSVFIPFGYKLHVYLQLGALEAAHWETISNICCNFLFPLKQHFYYNSKQATVNAICRIISNKFLIVHGRKCQK